MKTQGKRKSERQERAAARDLGGRVQKASGATDFAKGDVRVMGALRIECKTTGARQMIVRLADLEKIAAEALTGGMEGWAMQIEFQGQAGANKKYAIVDWHAFLDAAVAPRVL